MDKPKNVLTRKAKTLPKFAVPMPEAGEGAYVLMDLAAMEALEDGLGPNYWKICEEGFIGPSAMIIARALAVCLHGGEAEEAPWGLSLREVGRRLYDAQVRALRGITLAEAIELVEQQKAAEAQ